MKAHKVTVRFLFSCFIISLLPVPILAIDYNDFPPDLQQILNERIAQLNAEGGICIAGRVTMSDGAYINSGGDVMVNADVYGDLPLWVYPGGWYIMEHTIGNAGQGKHIFIRAFGYDPIDASVTVKYGEVTYLEFHMIKTAPENLAIVTGTVFDENNQPFNGATVTIKFPFSHHGYRSETGPTRPHMATITGPDGQYIFEGLSIAEHNVTAIASDYAYHHDIFTPPTGGTAVEDRKLFPNRRIIIDYVYQADGSRSFTGGDLYMGTIDWLNGSASLGIDFSESQLREGGLGRDLNMIQDQDVLRFRNVYGCVGNNGFYDAGVVDLFSVAEAAETGYSSIERPVLVGHVYVVRTCDESNYAKFIVKSDESSFRTIVPGDPDPIDFAGYGLTIDFTLCNNYGKVYVRKYSGIPAGIQSGALPYYWEITGMAGLTFSADLVITYDDTDVFNLGLSKGDLKILKSSDNGNTWVQLETLNNLLNNTLRAKGIDSFSWFAIATEQTSRPHTLRADLNNNGIVDFMDFAIMASEWFQTEPWYNEN